MKVRWGFDSNSKRKSDELGMMLHLARSAKEGGEVYREVLSVQPFLDNIVNN